MKPRRFTILLDASGTATAISVIKGVRKQREYEVRIIAIDMDDFNAGAFLSDKFYKVPPADATEYLNVVLDMF